MNTFPENLVPFIKDILVQLEGKVPDEIYFKITDLLIREVQYQHLRDVSSQPSQNALAHIQKAFSPLQEMADNQEKVTKRLDSFFVSQTDVQSQYLTTWKSVQNLIEGLSQNLESVKQNFAQAVASLITGLDFRQANVEKDIGKITEQTAEFGGWLKSLQDAIVNQVELFRTFQGKIEEMLEKKATALESMLNEKYQLPSFLQNMNSAQGKLVEVSENTISSGNKIADALQQIIVANNTLAAISQSITVAQSSLSDLSQKVQSHEDKVHSLAQKLIQEYHINELQPAIASLTDQFGTFDQRTDSIIHHLNSIIESVKKQEGESGNSISRLTERLQTWSERFQIETLSRITKTYEHGKTEITSSLQGLGTELKKLEQIFSALDIKGLEASLKESKQIIADTKSLGEQIHPLINLPKQMSESLKDALGKLPDATKKVDDYLEYFRQALSLISKQTLELLQSGHEHAIETAKLQTTILPEIKTLHQELQKANTATEQQATFLQQAVKKSGDDVATSLVEIKESLDVLSQQQQEQKKSLRQNLTLTGEISDKLSADVKQYLRQEMEKMAEETIAHFQKLLEKSHKDSQEDWKAEMNKVSAETKKEALAYVSQELKAIPGLLEKSMEKFVTQVQNLEKSLGNVVSTVNRMDVRIAAREMDASGEKRVTVFCPYCDKEASAPISFQGKRVLCKHCKKEFTFPTVET